ncbi:MAG: HAMP domain-containing sensor histidine kinase [Candidatus Moranbacteria bacterium]|nr:HAMP domain-containing sensor histidine kinase [Candidatus Moranbacteria bacterium]
MGNKNSSAKTKYVWLLQIIIVAAAGAAFYYAFLSVSAAVFLFVIVVVNSILFKIIFSELKITQESCSAETEDKSKKIEEFDKITRQLVKRELEVAHANQKLGELDAAKSDFISVAAHQLRTPLTGIKWSYTTLLDKETGSLNADQKEIVEKGLSAIDQSINLINDLLNVAHLEEGKLDFSFKRQSLIPIIKKAVDGIKLITEEKKITLTQKIPDEAGFPELNIDADKMALAVTNLLDNAVKYTPVGGRIDFSVDQDQGLVKISVQDSGIGIPKSQKERLFTKFFRADNATKVQTSGTGLGLFMVKNIVDRHGGKIIVESEEGKSTTFIITIPEVSAKKS